MRQKALRVVAGQDDRADPVIGLGPRHEIVERADQGIVEQGVGRVRERREEDAVPLFDADRAAHLPLRCIAMPAMTPAGDQDAGSEHAGAGAPPHP